MIARRGGQRKGQVQGGTMSMRREGACKLACSYSNLYERSTCMQTGKNVESQQLHKGNVMDLQLSKDGTHFITASTDMQVGRKHSTISLFRRM